VPIDACKCLLMCTSLEVSHPPTSEKPSKRDQDELSTD